MPHLAQPIAMATSLGALVLTNACRPQSDGPVPAAMTTTTPKTTETTEPRAANVPPSMDDLMQTVVANNVFFYYRDLPAALRFYSETLGFEVVLDYGFAKMLQVAPASYVTLVDATKGMHTADEPKTVALAIVTDDLEAWWTYLQRERADVKYPYKATPGGPHDGFVVVDPEGYLLEFERFNHHAENERLMPVLDAITPLRGVDVASSRRPDNLGVKATVVWLYYADLAPAERFYEDVLGLSLVVDQGWAKVYPTSPTGLLGLVDGARGMHKPTEQHGVTVSWFTTDVDGFFARLSNDSRIELRHDAVQVESDAVRVFVGYDPVGYFLEFDTFLPDPRNTTLLDRLGVASESPNR